MTAPTDNRNERSHSLPEADASTPIETPQERRNRRFQQFQAANPGRTYAEWLHQAAVNYVKSGGKHATLGANLNRHSNWWEAGRATFDRYRQLAPLPPQTRVIDYGCGSLRIGAHFIRDLDPGNFFGLDVSLDLIEVGKSLVGPDILDKKRPSFGTIAETSLAQAEQFRADLVISTAVCYHVHPDEAPTYFKNLLRLTQKPGAKLLFDASVSGKTSPNHALSKPVDYFVDMLRPMELVEFHMSGKRAEPGQTLGVLEFCRPIAQAPQSISSGAKARPLGNLPNQIGGESEDD